MNKKRWQELMHRIGLDTHLNTYSELLSCYKQKHRFYHNESHIDAVLKYYDESKKLANNCNAVEVALWFHDAIYKPYSSSNELKSANWAFNFLKEHKNDDTFAENVHSLIMATLHNASPKDNDEQLIVDIDLSILGSQTKVYAQFEKNIREEYKFVPNILYKKKRKEILSGFLKRERIYTHDFFHGKLEVLARANLTTTIEKL